MKTKIKLLPFIVLLCWFVTIPSHAAVVEDLYTIKLPVADQTTRVRLDTFKQAFADVLVKVSGIESLLTDPVFKRPLKQSTRYVKQFHYERAQLTEDAVEESALVLSIEFDEKLVEALLRSKAYPVWGRVRPSVLLVLAKRQNNKYELVSEDTASELIQGLDDLSQKHGLPMQFPLFDLEDRGVLRGKESVLDNMMAINKLATRYQSDVVVVGELTGKTGQGWKGVWQSRFSARLFQWENKAATKKAVLSKAMAHLSKILAQEYALGSAQDYSFNVEMTVSNVSTLKDYLSVARYLASLAVVEKTQIRQLGNEYVIFSLVLRNSPEELQRLIELSDVLEQIDLPVIDASIESGNEEMPQDTLLLNYRRL